MQDVTSTQQNMKKTVLHNEGIEHISMYNRMLPQAT